MIKFRVRIPEARKEPLLIRHKGINKESDGSV